MKFDSAKYKAKVYTENNSLRFISILLQTLISSLTFCIIALGYIFIFISTQDIFFIQQNTFHIVNYNNSIK